MDLLEFLEIEPPSAEGFESLQTPTEGSGESALACPLLSKEVAVRN
jgi:hypothetical protein